MPRVRDWGSVDEILPRAVRALHDGVPFPRPKRADRELRDHGNVIFSALSPALAGRSLVRADGEDKGESGAASGLSGLAGLAYHRSSDLVERVLATAREQLGMEVAFVSEFAGGRTVFRSLEGDAESFGLR